MPHPGSTLVPILIAIVAGCHGERWSGNVTATPDASLPVAQPSGDGGSGGSGVGITDGGGGRPASPGTGGRLGPDAAADADAKKPDAATDTKLDGGGDVLRYGMCAPPVDAGVDAKLDAGVDTKVEAVPDARGDAVPEAKADTPSLPPPPPKDRSGPFKMLVFSWTTGFHHDSIPAAQQMAKDLGANNPIQTFTVDIANASAIDPTGSCKDQGGNGLPQMPIPNCPASVSMFNDDNLKNYEVVFFANPTGDDFSHAGAEGVAAKAAFERFMNAGGAYVGVHSATDFDKGWTYYADLLGGLLDHHDFSGPATVILDSKLLNHPVIRGLPANWMCDDEWYIQQRDPGCQPGITVLARLSLDQRPVIWTHELTGGGRMFYTIRGHAIERYAEPAFRQLWLQGLMWAVHRLK